MKKLLLDLNVVLDVLLDRKPHVEASSSVWAAIEKQQAKGLLPAHGLTTIYYLIARERGAAVARRSLGAILSVFSVAAVDEKIIRLALATPLADFEDAVCAAAAAASGCDAIVSRDLRGFVDSPVPAIAPETAVALLNKGK